MYITGPTVLICAVMIAIIGVLEIPLSMLYTSRHKGGESNPFIPAMGISILGIIVGLFTIFACMSMSVQGCGENRNTDGSFQWILIASVFVFFVLSIRGLVKGVAVFLSEEKKSKRVEVQKASEPS